MLVKQTSNIQTHALSLIEVNQFQYQDWISVSSFPTYSQNVLNDMALNYYFVGKFVFLVNGNIVMIGLILP